MCYVCLFITLSTLLQQMQTRHWSYRQNSVSLSRNKLDHVNFIYWISTFFFFFFWLLPAPVKCLKVSVVLVVQEICYASFFSDKDGIIHKIAYVRYKCAVLIDQKNLTSSTFLSDAEIEQRNGPVCNIYWGLWA